MNIFRKKNERDRHCVLCLAFCFLLSCGVKSCTARKYGLSTTNHNANYRQNISSWTWHNNNALLRLCRRIRKTRRARHTWSPSSGGGGEIFSALRVSASLVVVTSKLFYILLFYYPEQSRIPCGWNLVYSAKTRI